MTAPARLRRWACAPILLFCGCAPARREAPAPAPSGPLSCAVVIAADGGTLTAQCGSGLEWIVLLGIDASGRALAAAGAADGDGAAGSAAKTRMLDDMATNYLRGVIHEKDKITVEFDRAPRDREGRLQGYVTLADGTLLNGKIVEDGFAVTVRSPAHPRYTDQFDLLLQEARQEKKGVWAR